MNRVLRVLDNLLIWLALWIGGSMAFFTIHYSLLSYSSRHFDPIGYLYWLPLTLLRIAIHEGPEAWLTLLSYLLGPPLGAWAIYRAVRWISGY
jgi:hypothetical protein